LLEKTLLAGENIIVEKKHFFIGMCFTSISFPDQFLCLLGVNIARFVILNLYRNVRYELRRTPRNIFRFQLHI